MYYVSRRWKKELRYRASATLSEFNLQYWHKYLYLRAIKYPMTENHDYNIPTVGESDWHIPLNENFCRIDTGVEIRDQESSLEQYEPKDGAKFLATDSGKVYLGDGNKWRRLSVTRGDTEFDSLRAASSSVTDRDNEINVRALDEPNLSDRVQVALELIDRSGTVRIPRPQGGGTWQWGGQLDISTDNYRGITLDIDRGVEIEYGGNGWVMTVTGPSSGGLRNTFAVDGIDAEFRATGNPEGFIRCEDQDHFTVRVNTRDFSNNSGDATAILVRNVENWCEGWKLSGDHRSCDRGVDFAPASITGGSGTESFVDGKIENMAFNTKRFGLRLRGIHKGNVFENLHIFFREDDTVGIFADGFLSNTIFIGPRFDSGQSGNETAIKTGPNFASAHSPLIIGPVFNRVGNLTARHSENHKLLSIKTEPGNIGFHNLGHDAKFTVSATGEISVVGESGTEIISTDPNGSIRKIGNWNTGSAQYFNDGINLPSDNGVVQDAGDLRQRSPEGNEIAMHDGSGSPAKSLCFEKGGRWFNVVDQTDF